MADESREWLEWFSTEYLVGAVHAMKAELLRRGLDECGLAMPILGVHGSGEKARHVTAAERERARVLMEDHIKLVPVPRRGHHECACGHDLRHHLPGCPVVARIRAAAIGDLEFEEEYLRVLAERDKVVTIKVRGKLEVES